MLASVTDAEEAETAVQHGAEIMTSRTSTARLAPPRPGPAGGDRTDAAATIVNAGASCVELSLYAHSAQEDCVRALS